jgi:minor capsid protein
MSQHSTIKWDSSQVLERMEAGAEQGLKLAAEHLLLESRKLVPIEEGTLERSGTVTVQGLEGSVSYDTPYAVDQHEDMTYEHDEGRTAKYLEGPARNEAHVIKDIIAGQIKQAMS